MVMELKDLQELKDSDPATWDYDRLTAMLHERNRVYKQMVSLISHVLCYT
jgi:hypothetical protein